MLMILGFKVIKKIIELQAQIPLCHNHSFHCTFPCEKILLLFFKILLIIQLGEKVNNDISTDIQNIFSAFAHNIFKDHV